jgi:protein SCO1/2
MASGPGSHRNSLFVLVGALLIASLGAYQLVSRAQSGSAKEKSGSLEVYGEIPDFTFTTQLGKPFTKDNMLGRVSIANFIFTRCPTVCPVFSMKMQRISEQLDASIQLVSFSVDPAYDTPERLAAFAAQYKADPKRWHFLTGEENDVKNTVEGALKIAMEREGVDDQGVPDIVHGTHFVLFDQQAQIRGYYDSNSPERIAELVRDAQALAR